MEFHIRLEPRVTPDRCIRCGENVVSGEFAPILHEGILEHYHPACFQKSYDELALGLPSR